MAKEQFLKNREGVVRWHRRLKEEEFWRDVDEEDQEDQVQTLVDKVRGMGDLK